MYGVSARVAALFRSRSAPARVALLGTGTVGSAVWARLARWLLAAHDRYDCQQFSSTQESLSQMLGVQRPTISDTAARMQREGLITYRRGNIEIVDRVGLRQIACECYRIVDQALTAVRDAGRPN